MLGDVVGYNSQRAVKLLDISHKGIDSLFIFFLSNAVNDANSRHIHQLFTTVQFTERSRYYISKRNHWNILEMY